VVALSQAVGLASLLLVLPGVARSAPDARDVQWGMLAGVAGSLGVSLLYRALALGTMGVVAPVTAVCAVALPVLVSVVAGARPSLVTAAGIVLALVAIVLIAQEGRAAADGPLPQSGTPDRRLRVWPPGVAHALASGVAIGGFFLVLARTGREAGLWPLLGSRAVSSAIFVAAAWGLGRPLRLSRRETAACAVCGVFDVAANVLYLFASREGSLPTVVTLASMYPASTVLLARVVLGERLNAVQTVGLGCALVAVAAIVMG